MPWQHHSNRAVPSDWARRRRAVYARDGHICHACGHGGADQIDHIVNVAAGGTHELHNLAPIHGGPCPTCSKRCHIDKTARESHASCPQRGRTPRRHPGDTACPWG